MAATNLAYAPVVVEERSNIIPFKIVEVSPKPKPKSAKSREYKGCPKKAGKSSEVYAFRTNEEIKAMIDVFDKQIKDATDAHHKKIASRNKLLFIVGINIGLRASDLTDLKYEFFFDKNKNGTLKFKEFYTLQPKKQRNSKKFVKLFFNETIKKAVTDYIKEYPIMSLDDYVFASAEGNGAITPSTLWRIIKVAAKKAGIEKNIGSHSLRKSWAYAVYNNAADKNNALVTLMYCFNHSNTAITAKYIGIIDDDIKSMYESVELGLEYI